MSSNRELRKILIQVRDDARAAAADVDTLASTPGVPLSISLIFRDMLAMIFTVAWSAEQLLPEDEDDTKTAD